MGKCFVFSLERMNLKLIVIWNYSHLLNSVALKALNMNHGKRFAGIIVYAAQRLAGRRPTDATQQQSINNKFSHAIVKFSQ